jgi:hypothetical protein
MRVTGALRGAERCSVSGSRAHSAIGEAEAYRPLAKNVLHVARRHAHLSSVSCLSFFPTCSCSGIALRTMEEGPLGGPWGQRRPNAVRSSGTAWPYHRVWFFVEPQTSDHVSQPILVILAAGVFIVAQRRVIAHTAGDRPLRGKEQREAGAARAKSRSGGKRSPGSRLRSRGL